MKEFTVPMALFDIVPVALFFISAVRIGMDVGKHAGIVNMIFYWAGAGVVTCAGCFKALYKLAYAVGAGDILWMNDQFFPNQTLGFLLIGSSLLFSLRGINDKKSSPGNMAVIPTMGLVGISVVGLCAMFAALCRYAAKLKKTSAIVIFVISFFLSLCMGYLSSRNFDTAAMNWIAQCVNTAAQLMLCIGSMILHKAGLGKE